MLLAVFAAVAHQVPNIDYDIETGTVNVAAASELEDVQLTLTSYLVTFTVTESWGNFDPVEGVELTVTNEARQEWTEITNGNGIAIFALPIGNFEFSVDAEGYTYSGTTSFSVIDQDIEIPVALGENIVDPYGLTIDVVGSEATLGWNNLEQIMLFQHDGTIPPTPNAYFQLFNQGFGVVFDLTDYPGAIIDAIDFHHKLWGIAPASFEYKVHLINWTDFSTIDVVGPLSTMVNDDWELDIDLGSISSGGTTLLGVFIEPLGNIPTDAYPVISADNTGDGVSVKIGDLSDISGTYEASTVGDFFINLWISTPVSGKSFKAGKLVVNPATPTKTRSASIVHNPSTPFKPKVKVAEVPLSVINYLQSAKSFSKNAYSYNVYLDDLVTPFATGITTTSFIFTNLTSDMHTAGVESVYETGNSNIVTIDFDITVSVNEFDKKRINIYPNPSNGIFSISVDGVYSLEVRDISGKVVLSQELTNAKNSINVGKPGVYTLRLTNSETTINYKVIVK